MLWVTMKTPVKTGKSWEILKRQARAKWFLKMMKSMMKRI